MGEKRLTFWEATLLMVGAGVGAGIMAVPYLTELLPPATRSEASPNDARRERSLADHVPDPEEERARTLQHYGTMVVAAASGELSEA